MPKLRYCVVCAFAKEQNGAEAEAKPNLTTVRWRKKEISRETFFPSLILLPGLRYTKNSLRFRSRFVSRATSSESVSCFDECFSLPGMTLCHSSFARLFATVKRQRIYLNVKNDFPTPGEKGVRTVGKLSHQMVPTNCLRFFSSCRQKRVRSTRGPFLPAGRLDFYQPVVNCLRMQKLT